VSAALKSAGGADVPKRKLAVVLFSALGLAALVDALLVISLAVGHKPCIGPLASMVAFIPGFIIAARAWQGRLPSRCGPAN
jgi:hypothetical protein